MVQLFNPSDYFINQGLLCFYHSSDFIVLLNNTLPAVDRVYRVNFEISSSLPHSSSICLSMILGSTDEAEVKSL